MNSTNLKMLRAKYNKSQKEIADILGLSLVGYSKKENGINSFNLDEAKKISELFGLPIESIFFDDLVHANGILKYNFQSTI